MENNKRKNSVKQNGPAPNAKQAKISESTENDQKVEDKGTPVVDATILDVPANNQKEIVTVNEGETATKTEDEVIETATDEKNEDIKDDIDMKESGDGTKSEEDEKETKVVQNKQEQKSATPVCTKTEDKVIETATDEKNEDIKDDIETKENGDETKSEEDEKETKVVQNKQQEQKSATPKKYILFIGNLPYDVKEEDIREHFSVCETIKEIRLPKNETTKLSRGYCYLELTNATDFEKAFCKHHSSINGRRINVELPKAKRGEGNKKANKKNLKLKAMRDKGLLAGSVKKTNKRSFRRGKKAKLQKNNKTE